MDNKNQLVKLWFTKAEHDLMTITNNLVNKSEPLTDICCFHAQQAIEKMLKGALVFFGKHVTKTHDLIYLVNQLHEYIPELQQYNNQYEKLRPRIV
ncbi:HEPN domain-containing protein [bacterium]|nr:HEPN domain-containing protein [bacterium]